MLKTRNVIQLGLLAVAFLVLAPRSSAQTVTCSSNDMRRQYCPMDTRGGVQLLQQRSDAACREGYSWGYDRNGIWVDHGCRADFAVGSYRGGVGPQGGLYGGSNSGTITCSSDDMHRQYCPMDTRGGVRLLQQRSGSPCRQGYSWGYDRNGIWVDHGCRADFVVEGRGAGRGPGWDGNGGRGPGWNGNGGRGRNSTQVITCSSNDMHRQYCPTDTRGGVQLLQQRSGSACRQGYSWGYDRNGIWVDHGCRADFQVQ